MNYTLQTSNFA